MIEDQEDSTILSDVQNEEYDSLILAMVDQISKLTQKIGSEDFLLERVSTILKDFWKDDLVVHASALKL